jgi:ribonuclease D
VTAEVAARAAEHGRLAIDTEFMSERRYRALLCLAQVAVPDPETPDGVRTEVLDPLDGPALDPAPLARVLADPAVQVVVHAGRQDVAILRRTWRTDITNVLDTQVAAGFLGLGTQEGYESLVRRVLKVKLKGGESFTRWDRRPLTDRQIEYARADASRLLALGEEIERRLEEKGRLEWARQECRVVEESSDERDPETLYRRLPRLGRLDDESRAVAFALVRWREETAAAADRAATSIVPDQSLVELARQRPRTKEELEHVRGLPAATLHRRARELVEAIEAGRDGPAPPVPSEPPRRDSRDAPLVNLAQAVVRHRAQESGIAAELIATQADVAAVVSAVRRSQEPSTRVTEGWRRDLVGAELLELLAGRLTVRVGEDGRLALE